MCIEGVAVDVHLFLNFVLNEGVVNFKPQPIYLLEITTASIKWEAGWAPEPFWMMSGFEPKTVQLVCYSCSNYFITVLLHVLSLIYLHGRRIVLRS